MDLACGREAADEAGPSEEGPASPHSTSEAGSRLGLEFLYQGVDLVLVRLEDRGRHDLVALDAVDVRTVWKTMSSAK
jgi:hypothetical protein